MEVGRNLGSMTARTLKLLDLYGADLLAAAVQQVLERGLHDPGALACTRLHRYDGLVRPFPSHWYSAPHGSTTWRSPLASR